MFLHKSDLIPFVVELSPYISGTAVVSLLLKPVKKRDMFSRVKTYKPGAILFLLGEVHHLQGVCMYSTSKQPLYNSIRTQQHVKPICRFFSKIIKNLFYTIVISEIHIKRNGILFIMFICFRCFYKINPKHFILLCLYVFK